MARIVYLLLLLISTTAFAANSDHSFGGVGIDGVPDAQGRIVVRQIVSGGPAQLAGIVPGDVILSIDGKPTEGSNFHDLVEHRLRGRAGTHVLLKVRHPGRPEPFNVTLTRRQLNTPVK